MLLPRFGHLPVVTRTNQGIAQYKHVAFIVVPVLVIFFITC
ncbi:hypothetical protein THOG05_570015 [Vibrio rotiferianus]|nr:hypothetical protein THOG05_570015 [Vibrio rotiferianus]